LSSRMYVFTGSLILAFMAVRTDAGADWPCFRGSNHDGISTEKLHVDATTRVEPRWAKTLGLGCSSVAIKEGRLYTMGNTGTKGDPNSHEDVVYCLDAGTGAEIWRHSYKCGLNFKSNTPAGPFATPTVDGSNVYTFSRKGDVFCFDAAAGKVRWHRDLKEELGMKPPFQGGFAGSPLALDNMVILNAGHAGTALDKNTGAVIWKSAEAEAAQATPVPFKHDGKQCVAIFSGFGLVVVDASDGRELWSFPWDTKYKTNVADPVIADGKVFISSWYRMGCALLDISKTEPNMLWQNKQMQNHYGTCILNKGWLYGFDVGRLKCMSFTTGDVAWSVEGFGRGSLVMADGKLIVLTEKGRLLIAEASPGEFSPLLRADIIQGRCFTGPVFCDRKVYARNDKGDLVCVVLKSSDSRK